MRITTPLASLAVAPAQAQTATAGKALGAFKAGALLTSYSQFRCGYGGWRGGYGGRRNAGYGGWRGGYGYRPARASAQRSAQACWDSRPVR